MPRLRHLTKERKKRLLDFSEIVPSRTLYTLYIWLDIAFLVLLAVLLLRKKRYQTFLWGLGGGILYFIVDYGIFYLWLGTRQVTGADPFWFLLWLSMSYGFTNFAWIWLVLGRDEHLKEWTILILAAWLGNAWISQSFGVATGTITILRGTGNYHGFMAAMLLLGYAILAIHNLFCAKAQRYPILRIFATGVAVQFGWEFALLVTGIRAAGLGPLIVNSLLETNMGLPYIYLIFRAVRARRDEQLKPL